MVEIVECAPRCEDRCSKTHHKKPCLFYCKYCCAKCLCVPPGTYGNKEVCPCYNDWKTQEGGPKCPWIMFFSFLIMYYTTTFIVSFSYVFSFLFFLKK